MSQYPYGGNPPQYPAPNNQIYPQIYNPANAPPGQPGFPPTQPYPYQPQPQPGFAYPGYPGQPGINPTPTAPPSGPAFSYPGYPGVTPQQGYAPPAVEWIPTNPRDAASLSDRAVVAGYEGYDKSPLWAIRARYEGDMLPGKLAIKHHAAYVPWGGKENTVNNIELCCARPERIRWVESSNGAVPPNAIVAGNTSNGEPLYLGRAKHMGSLTPGKVHPSHKNMYISFGGEEIAYNNYEVLCTI